MNKLSIEQTVCNRISVLLSTIKGIKEKFDTNYFHAFEWKTEELFKCHYELQKLEAFLRFIQENPEKSLELLEYNCSEITRTLLTVKLIGSSSNHFANLKHTYGLEVDCELHKLYSSFIKMVKNESMPILNK